MEEIDGHTVHTNKYQVICDRLDAIEQKLKPIQYQEASIERLIRAARQYALMLTHNAYIDSRGHVTTICHSAVEDTLEIYKSDLLRCCMELQIENIQVGQSLTG